MAPTSLASTVPAAKKPETLHAAIGTVLYLQSRKEIYGYCNVVFGEAQTTRLRRTAKSRRHANTRWTAPRAQLLQTAMRLASTPLRSMAGEEANAKAWKKVIASMNFLMEDFEADVSNFVRACDLRGTT